MYAGMCMSDICMCVEAYMCIVYIIDIDLRHSVERVHMYVGMCVEAYMYAGVSGMWVEAYMYIVYIIYTDLRHSGERVYMYAGMCVDDAYMFIVYMIYTDLCHSVERAARRGPPIRVGVGGAEQRLG